MKYKLIAVDVDGTLLDSKKNLSEYSINIIRAAVAKGVVFCISSGRPIYAADKFTKLLGLEDMPFILYNGAVVVTGPEHKRVFEQGLSSEDALWLIKKGCEIGSTVIVWSADKLYVNEFNERTENYRILSMIDPVLIPSPEELAAQGVTKMIWYDDLSRMPMLRETIDNSPISEHINYFTSNPLFMELVDKKCSKALALEKLSASLGIKREEIIAIGDGYNDLPMIEYAGLGIAMANAAEEIRNAADAVTLSNDEDGVAAAIIKYVLADLSTSD